MPENTERKPEREGQGSAPPRQRPHPRDDRADIYATPEIVEEEAHVEDDVNVKEGQTEKGQGGPPKK